MYGAPSADHSQRSQVKVWLKEAIQTGHDVDRLEPKLATILYLEGRFDEAEAIYRRVLDRNPEDAESLNALAWELALREPGKTDESLILVNRAIQFHGRLPSLLTTRGVVLIRANRFDQAVGDLRVARSSEPTNANFAFHLAWALQASGNIDAARKEFREAERLGMDTKRGDPLSRTVFERLRLTLAGN